MRCPATPSGALSRAAPAWLSGRSLAVKEAGHEPNASQVQELEVLRLGITVGRVAQGRAEGGELGQEPVID